MLVPTWVIVCFGLNTPMPMWESLWEAELSPPSHQPGLLLALYVVRCHLVCPEVRKMPEACSTATHPARYLSPNHHGMVFFILRVELGRALANLNRPKMLYVSDHWLLYQMDWNKAISRNHWAEYTKFPMKEHHMLIRHLEGNNY